MAGGYALPPDQRLEWLAAEKGLSILGFPDTAKGRRGTRDEKCRQREHGLEPDGLEKTRGAGAFRLEGLR